MNKTISGQSSRKGISSLAYALGLGLLLTGCASTGSSSGGNTRQAEDDDIRSEMVLLNIPEASGWVAYNCNPTGSQEMEDYRVVVIRQKSGEIIYDSQIPLAVDLCTHGFEMALDDPRLQRLARNVDTEIIGPLEAYQKSLKRESTETAPPPQKKKKPEVEAAAPVADTPMEAAGTLTPSVNDDTKPRFKIVGMKDGDVLLESVGSEMLNPGDRLFLLTEPKVISIPGSNETLTASEGEVAGLVEVISVADKSAQAKILSGEAPASGHAQKIE